MNVYDTFFENISPESWEFFATDFLISLGYTVIQYPSRGADGGMDALVEVNKNKYLVSCKHYIKSGASVGVEVEHSIIDRIIQSGASGFIGFYSTLPSTALSTRFNSLKKQGYDCLVYDKNVISNFLPKISSHILQKYGLPNHIKYVMNVDEHSYIPLNCLRCGVDILQDNQIPNSMALICFNKNGELEYFYGCKSCLLFIHDLGWVEISQSLHQEEFNGWVNFVDNYLNQHKPSQTFYKHKSEYESRVPQRMFPSNWGQWLSIT